MRVNEAAEATGISKRAVKYYEEEGLLSVDKDQNGYRNYTDHASVPCSRVSDARKGNPGYGSRVLWVLLYAAFSALSPNSHHNSTAAAGI